MEGETKSRQDDDLELLSTSQPHLDTALLDEDLPDFEEEIELHKTYGGD